MNNERIKKYELLCDMVKKDVEQMGVKDTNKKIKQAMELGQSYGSLTNQELKELMKETPVGAFVTQFYSLKMKKNTSPEHFYVEHLIQALQETALNLYNENYSLIQIRSHIEGSIMAVSPNISKFNCITRNHDLRNTITMEIKGLSEDHYFSTIKRFLEQLDYSISDNEKAIRDLADYTLTTLILE